MKIHTCEKCGYTTNQKTHYKNHLNRKKPCSPLKTTTATTAGTTATTAGTTATTAGTTATTAETTATTAEINVTTADDIRDNKRCQFCNKVFKRKYNLTEHINLKRCKELKKLKKAAEEDEGDDIEYIIEEETENEAIKTLSLEVEKLREKIESQEEKIIELESKPSVINNNNNIHNHIYCVIMDKKTVDQVLDEHFTLDAFYNGPCAGISVLNTKLFKKDIKLLDSGRQIFEYLTIPDDETKERVVKDIKNYKVLCNTEKSYTEHVKKIMVSEMNKHAADPIRQAKIFDIGQNHLKMINNQSMWSSNWCKVVGK